MSESTLRVGVDSRDMVSGARRGIRALRDLAGGAQDVEDDLDGLTGSSRLLARAFQGLTAIGIAGFFAAATTASGAFETKMAEISTLVDTAVFDIDRLEGSLLDAAGAFGSMPTEQAAAAYAIISAGASSAAQATDTLTAANMLAIGGVTDVATAADGLTSVLNAYGDQVDGATAVSDALFVGMRAGKTTIGELSSSLGTVAPLAAQAGVGFDELVAATAALTKGGIGTNEAITGLRAVMAAVVKPSQEAADMAESLGLEFNAAALEAKGLEGFMSDLVAKTGGSTEVMAQLFGGVEALVPVLALAGTAGGDFTSIMEDMAEKGGATQEAFEKMTNTFEFQSARLRGGITAEMIKLGDVILKIITPAIKFLADNLQTFSRFLQAAALGFSVALLPALLSTIPAIASVTTGLLAMAAAWLLTPFGQIAALIIAASAALAYFGDKQVEIGGQVTTVWGTFVAAVQVAWDLIKEGVQIYVDVFGSITSVVTTFFQNVVNWLMGYQQDWSSAISTVGGYIKTGINAYIGFFVGMGSAVGTIVTEGIPAAFNLAMALAKNAVLDAMQFIVEKVAFAIGTIAQTIGNLPGFDDNLGIDTYLAIANTGLPELKSNVAGLTEEFNNAGAAIQGAFGQAQVDYVGAAGDALGAVGDNLEGRLVTKLEEANTEFATAAENAQEVTDAVTPLTPELESLGGAAGGAASAMSDLNKEKKEFIEGINDEFAAIQEANGGAVEASQLWYETQKATLDALGLAHTEYADKLEVIFAERLADAYRQDLENATDWRSGLELAVLDLGESVATEADLAGAALTSMFDNAATAITDFAKTGKLDFKSFASSVAADILQMTTKMLLLKALKASIGGFADGGMVSGGAGIPGFATGGYVSGPGGPRSDSIPAMLSNGEFVINAQATKQFGPLLDAINSGNMEMMGLAAGGLANDTSTISAPAQAPASSVDDSGKSSDKGTGGNITIVPQIAPKDIVDTFDSDDGDRVLVNMMERNATTIRGILG